MTQQPTDKLVTVVPTESSSDAMVEYFRNQFKCTTKQEKSILFNMIRLMPNGLNKHLNMLVLSRSVSKELKQDVSAKCLWKYLQKHWNIGDIDFIEHINIKTNQSFCVPEDYEDIVGDASEQIRKVQEYESKKESSKKKIFSTGKIRTKSNSVSSVDSKDGLIETVPSILSESLSVKTIDVGSEEIPRRSLRTYEKPEEKELENDYIYKKKLLRGNTKSDEQNKSIKVLNKKTLDQSKDLEKNETALSNIRCRKRKIRNISESSFSSDNSKQTRSQKNNCTDMNVSDRSSRSVTPEIHRNKSSNRSITPETIGRKSNLRSGDKSVIEKAYLKYGHNVDLILPEIKIERIKPEKNEKKNTSLDLKSKHLIQNKNETQTKFKGKLRERVTSDYLVTLQASELPMSRRSCNSKS